jgi:hypothetical protein
MNELPKLASIEDDNKVLTMLCYLLEYLGGLTESQLLEIVTADELVAPFKVNDALDIIEKRELATLSDGVYKISEPGKTWLQGYENSLAITLRRKVLQEGKNVLRLAELRKAVTWKVTELAREGKHGEEVVWAFHARFLNEADGTPLMEIKLYSKTKDGALNAQENFLKDPAKTLSDSIGTLI